MWVDQDQISQQIQSDRAEFSALSTEVRNALTMQVEILRRSHLQVHRRPIKLERATA